MFSFFKPKVSVTQYVNTRLEILFSEEQARLWNRLRSESHYLSLSKLFGCDDETEKLYLDEMMGAHLQLISLALRPAGTLFGLLKSIHANELIARFDPMGDIP